MVVSVHFFGFVFCRFLFLLFVVFILNKNKN